MKRMFTIYLFPLFFCCSISFGKELIVNPRNTAVDEYVTINEAISAAAQGDIINILPGEYKESLQITQDITIKGSGPNKTYIISNNGDGFSINNTPVKIEALSINSSGSGIYTRSSFPIISNVVINGCGKEGILILGGSVTIINTTIANCNTDGIYVNADSYPSTTSIQNSILYANGDYGFKKYGYKTTSISLTYSCLFMNKTGSITGAVLGLGCIERDPLFIDPDAGTFRLQSSSPCKNAGIPGSENCDPDGTRNDMGAWGGPGSAHFFTPINGGPAVTRLLVLPASVPQGETFKVEATGSVR